MGLPTFWMLSGQRNLMVFTFGIEKKLCCSVVKAQLKPSCSHSSSVQVIFNNLNKGDFLIFLSGSTSTTLPAGKPPQMACATTVSS